MVGAGEVYVPPLAVTTGDALHRERGGAESVVHFVAHLEGVERDSGSNYSAGGCWVEAAGGFHCENAFFYYAGHCTSPTCVNGGYGAGGLVVEEYGDAVGSRDADADALFAGVYGIDGVQLSGARRGIESEERFIDAEHRCAMCLVGENEVSVADIKVCAQEGSVGGYVFCIIATVMGNVKA